MSAGEPRSQRIAMIAGGVLLVVLAIVASRAESPRSEEVNPSSFVVGEGGGKALHDVAEELGLEPRRWMRSLAALDDVEGGGLMVVLAPREEIEQDEADALLRWVDRGGMAIYVPRSEKPDDDAAPGEGSAADPILRGLFGDAIPRVVLHKVDESFQRGPGESQLGEDLLADALRPIDGVTRAFDFTDAMHADVEPLVVARDRLFAAALVRRELGDVLLVSDAAPLTNGKLSNNSLAPFVLRALAILRDGGPLWFDEFHHGFDEDAGVLLATWRWLVGTRLGRALLAVAGIGLIALIFAGLRLGAPVPRPRKEPRSALEHVEALARAWLRARAQRRPRELLLEGLRMRLGTAGEAAQQARIQEMSARVRDPIALAAAIDAFLKESEGGGRK